MPKNGRGWLAFLLLLSSTLSGPNPASAEILFKADFETGDLSQFGGKSRNVMPGDIEVVTDVVHSGKYAGRIQASYEEGAQAGVSSTPTLLVGNRLYRGRIDSDAIRRLVDSLSLPTP